MPEHFEKARIFRDRANQLRRIASSLEPDGVTRVTSSGQLTIRNVISSDRNFVRLLYPSAFRHLGAA